MPIFYVDDDPLEFEPGEMVLHAILRQGKFVPHYCYHPGLQVTAQCRQCLVDIVDMGNGRGAPKLMTSCSTPASENMKVETKTEKVKEGQALINEYLLVNHPLDCPICDQAGECDLQDFAFQFGSGESEMNYEKRVYGVRNVGTFIALERNRCVQCSRCERFSRDLVGTHDFGMFFRSHEITFDTFEDDYITHKFQGNLADICPVGAITNRHWRFKKRAWKFEKTPTVCTSCSTGCNVTLEHHGNRVFRLKPRENHAVNRWWMCDEGRVNIEHLNEREHRTTEPYARVEDTLRAADWQALYQAIAARVKEIGATAEEVVALADTHATNEELHQFRTLVSEAFSGGTVYFPYRPGVQQEKPPRELDDDFIFTLITTDKSPNTEGAVRLGLMGDENDQRLKAALRTPPKVALILGDPFADQDWVREAVQQAELIVHIGTLSTGWDEMADAMLPGYTSAEKYGTYTNKSGRVQRIQPSVRAPADAREQVRILAELGRALGTKPLPEAPQAVFDDLGAQEGAFQGLTWDDIDEMGLALEQDATRATA